MELTDHQRRRLQRTGKAPPKQLDLQDRKTRRQLRASEEPSSSSRYVLFRQKDGFLWYCGTQVFRCGFSSSSSSSLEELEKEQGALEREARRQLGGRFRSADLGSVASVDSVVSEEDGVSRVESAKLAMGLRDEVETADANWEFDDQDEVEVAEDDEFESEMERLEATGALTDEAKAMKKLLEKEMGTEEMEEEEEEEIEDEEDVDDMSIGSAEEEVKVISLAASRKRQISEEREGIVEEKRKGEGKKQKVEEELVTRKELRDLLTRHGKITVKVLSKKLEGKLRFAPPEQRNRFFAMVAEMCEQVAEEDGTKYLVLKK